MRTKKMKYKINNKYEIEAESRLGLLEQIILKENIKIEEVVEEKEKIEITDVRNKMPFKKSNGKMDKRVMDTVVIHHDAEFRPDVYPSLPRYINEANFHISKGYGHISYHYIIDNVGEIFYCLDETEVAYHCGNYAINLKSLAIKLDGNMEEQKPTKQQIKSLQKLLVWLTTQRPDIPKILRNSIKGHRDIKATACPGKNLYPLIHKF